MTDPQKPRRYDTCGSKLSKGKPGSCTRPAGWGTDHPGIGACKLHGGSTPSHKTAAVKEQARRDVALFAARRDIDPGDALLELVQWTAGEVDYWRQEVQLLEREELTWGVTKVKEGGDDRGTTEEAKPHIAYVMYTDASNRLKEYSVAALRAGVEERRVRIAEDMGRQIAGVLQVFAASMLASVVERLDEGPSVFREVWSAAVAVNAPAALRGVGGGVG